MVIVEVPHFSLSYDVREHVAFHGKRGLSAYWVRGTGMALSGV